MCAASIKARPDNRAPSRALCRITDACPKEARRVPPALLDRHCPTPAEPSRSTNPHSAAYAARGFLHVRISYARAPEILRQSRRSNHRRAYLKTALRSRIRRRLRRGRSRRSALQNASRGSGRSFGLPQDDRHRSLSVVVRRSPSRRAQRPHLALADIHLFEMPTGRNGPLPTYGMGTQMPRILSRRRHESTGAAVQGCARREKQCANGIRGSGRRMSKQLAGVA